MCPLVQLVINNLVVSLVGRDIISMHASTRR
jgi:hypothetical protein